MKFPFLVSVPHAGESVPTEVEDICLLNRKEVLAESDEGARAIYFNLKEHCEAFLTTDIARTIIDLNRAPGDIGADGVIKEHTCWNVPVYKKFPDARLVRSLLARYYFPYHAQLSAGSGNKAVRLGIDCHTMSAVGPPLGPDPGRERPLVCVSNADGTCPEEWLRKLADCLSAAFNETIAINTPFQGGYITRHHAAEMPWIQVELSRSASFTDEYKRDCLLAGLHRFCHTVF